VSRRSRTEADNGAGADTDTTINILDIFGFEAFRTNGFEQVWLAPRTATAASRARPPWTSSDPSGVPENIDGFAVLHQLRKREAAAAVHLLCLQDGAGARPSHICAGTIAERAAREVLLWRSAGQEEYTREGIDWEFIEFRDNQAPLLCPFAFAMPLRPCSAPAAAGHGTSHADRSIERAAHV
jgi:hypothetical protein